MLPQRTQVLYQLSAKDSNGDVRHFEKPLFLTFIMFVAMACAMPVYCLQQVQKNMYKLGPALQSSGVLVLLLLRALCVNSARPCKAVGCLYYC